MAHACPTSAPLRPNSSVIVCQIWILDRWAITASATRRWLDWYFAIRTALRPHTQIDKVFPENEVRRKVVGTPASIKAPISFTFGVHVWHFIVAH